MVSRPVAVLVMAKLVIKGTMSASMLWLARRMVTRLAAELPGRKIHATADPAYQLDALRADLDRFTFLLGGNDGEFLGEDPPA